MKKHKKSQTGRSIVEMLAVLTISAVLAITGITAYNYSINKHRANELVHRINMGYVEILSYDEASGWVDLKTKTIDGKTLQGFKIGKDAFVLATNVEFTLCNRIISDNTIASILSIDNGTVTCDSAGTDMVFNFSGVTSMQFPCTGDTCFDGQYCSKNTNMCVDKNDNCPEGDWNMDIDACDTCESVNGESAPIYTTGVGCEPCATETPVWDTDNKKCQECLTDIDCLNEDKYACGSDNVCVECTVDNQTACVKDTFCQNQSCVNCPTNSGTVQVAGQDKIENTLCYCKENYVYDETLKMCVFPIPEICNDGFIVTANNGIQYCVSNEFLAYDDANSFCMGNKMSLQSLESLECDDELQQICNNMKGIGSIRYVWTNTEETKTSHLYDFYYRVELRSGNVSSASYRHFTGYDHALCR